MMTFAEQLKNEGFSKGRLEGHQEGHLEGHTEGRLVEKEAIAIKALKQGVSAQMVAQFTDLSLERIEQIKQEQHLL